jgi:hypothetical protein
MAMRILRNRRYARSKLSLLPQYFQCVLILSDSSLTNGERSRELGWKPLKDDSRWEETIAEEFEVALKDMTST